MAWLIVAITPILNSALTTSPPLSAIFCARSATVMDSPMATSRTIGAVGRVKPLPERACSDWRRGLGLPRALVERRARSDALRCIWPAKRLVRSSSSTVVTIACEPRVLCAGAPRAGSGARAGAGFGWPWPCVVAGLRTAFSSSSATSTLASASLALASSSALRRAASAASRRAASAVSARRRSSAASFSCSARLRCLDSSSLRRISERSSVEPASAGLTSVTFLRTTTSTVERFLPPPTVSSCLRLRFSVIFFGASTASAPWSALPWARLRKPSSLTFSILVTTWSGPLKLMPASASCSSNFSTGVFTSSASLRMVVCCDIRFPVPFGHQGASQGGDCRAGHGPPHLHMAGLNPPHPRAEARPTVCCLLEPVLAGFHDQGRGALGVDALDIGQLVGRHVGQVVTGDHATRGQRERGALVHAVQFEQVGGRLVFVELFLGGQRLVEQRVAGTRTQLLDDVLVESLDGEQFADRYVGDFLDRAEAFRHQNAGDFLVDLELVLEQL